MAEALAGLPKAARIPLFSWTRAVTLLARTGLKPLSVKPVARSRQHCPFYLDGRRTAA
ncbi:hypothetical protein BURKHO8Y_120048 [Burkholderia sp. 8Y]|nr:hypothetical protein BURKHO8Y_120048 [Burkholderia sp. 8Y]